MSLFFFVLLLLNLSLVSYADDVETSIRIKKYLESHFPKNKELQEVYKSHSYTPFWTNAKGLNECSKSVFKRLNNAWKDGLVENYEETMDHIKTLINQEKTAESDVLLTSKILKFINELLNGQINPLRIHSEKIKIKPTLIRIKEIFEYLKFKGNQCNLFESVSPQHTQYKKLGELLQDYHEIYEDLIKVSIEQFPFEAGDESNDLKTIRQALLLFGEIEEEDTEDTVYNQDLIEAIKRFQKRFNLLVDGILGEQTFKKLTEEIENRVKKIIANMERWRWFPLNLEKKHALVNVAGYELFLIEDHDISESMKVVVGRVDRPTPIFTAPLTEVVLNPAWGLPETIVKDKLNETGGSLSALRLRNYIIKDKNGLDILGEEYSHISDLRITVPPGPYNGLGGYKFTIENDYAIYPHGTNQPEKFRSKERNFSSGCIRLEKPDTFAEWVLETNCKTEWDKDSLNKEVKKGLSKTIALKKSIPFYIGYFTVWVDEDDQSVFFNDPYGIDNIVIQSLGI